MRSEVRCSTYTVRRYSAGATSDLFEGLVAKVSGTGGIDFEAIGRTLLFLLGLYILSAVFNFIQGWIMTGVTQNICYRMRREISEKINRMPFEYFESRTVGEVLSRITNDVDTLGMSLNQSDDAAYYEYCHDRRRPGHDADY